MSAIKRTREILPEVTATSKDCRRKAAEDACPLQGDDRESSFRYAKRNLWLPRDGTFGAVALDFKRDSMRDRCASESDVHRRARMRKRE